MTLRFVAGASALALLIASPALAQRTPLYQDGVATANHAAKFTAQGRVTDAGGISGDTSGKGVAPYAITDSLGLGLCSHSASTGGTGQYNSLCLGHDANGNGQITLDSFGGMAVKDLNVVINGTSYPFPGAGNGNVIAPTSPTPTTGNVALWNGGTTLKDSHLGTNALGGINAAVSMTSGAIAYGSAQQFIFTDANTAAGTGNGSFLVRHNFSGGSLAGDRAAFASILMQDGAVAATSSPGYNYSGGNIYSIMNYNAGGSDSSNAFTSVGLNFGANIIAELNSGATNYNANVGLEVDVFAFGGASVYRQIGVYSVKVGPVNGTVEYAMAVDAQNGATWGGGIDLGNTTNPYPTTAKLLVCTVCTGTVADGIYMPDTTFSHEALHLGDAVSVTGAGVMTLGGSALIFNANSAAQIDKGGFGPLLEMGGPASPATVANHVSLVATAAGGTPSLSVLGTDTNVNLSIAAKGTGAVLMTGPINLNLVSGAGASAKSVCADSAGNVLLKAGAC